MDARYDARALSASLGKIIEIADSTGEVRDVVDARTR